MDLSEYLLARITEDEAAALEAMPGAHLVEPGTVWDPARVLAECDAKRRIVEAYEQSWYVRGGPTLDVIGWAEEQRGRGRALEHVLRLLALPYADHADYHSEWALQVTV